jgi:CheY-like chemotaxis protein
MSRLVDDLLDVTRVTSGKVRLEQEPLALDAVVSSALEGLQRAIGEKGLKVFYDGDPQVWVLGDALRLEQVAMNLIENAVKYTARGEVHVAVRRNGEGAELTVRDTGTGIAPEMLPRVFDLFSQAGVALDRSQGGLGIGLTIVRRLVELHGGRVTADSPGLGYGSTFTVSLPALAGHEARRKEAPAEPARACRHLRILVVDDNTDAAEALVEILRMWGHTAWSVHDGLAALKEAQEGQPDVALLDIGLPRMDGYEVARRLRDEARLAALKIIAVTGYGQDSDRQKARAARFDNHLVKPVPLDALEQLLAQI